MKRVSTFSALLLLGLVTAKFLPELAGANFAIADKIVNFLTLTGLGFIMIHVGYEFEIDISNLKPYGWDYVVAMTAAAFPWIFVSLYFVFVMLPATVWESWAAWTEILLAGRFSAPTSAGVLFSMLAAAGLSATWVFRKARILAIFDDLDTILLMIPLKMMIVGAAWQLGVIVVIVALALWLCWCYLHQCSIPTSWPWVLGYSLVIVIVAEIVYQGSKAIDAQVPIHLEVLLPAFILGAIMKRPSGVDPLNEISFEGHHECADSPTEQRVGTVISGAFMLLVGLSMASVFTGVDSSAALTKTMTAQQPIPELGTLLLHVLAVTFLANLGKMFPAFCYRREASCKERLALAVGMWPRGEVGAGVLVVSISYGIGGPIVTVAALSLALNLVLTGGFIWVVRRLLVDTPQPIRL